MHHDPDIASAAKRICGRGELNWFEQDFEYMRKMTEMTMSTSNQRAPDLRDFFSFAREAELSIVKSGRESPTTCELETYSSEYWNAVNCLRDRVRTLNTEQPATDPVVQKFLDLTMRSEVTWRSRMKPRGYAGDYRLMELLYELNGSEEQKTFPAEPKAPGQRLLEGALAQAHGVRVVQKRVKLLEAFLADEIANSDGPLKILDVGGGGARYFRRAVAKANGAHVSYTIFDQDPSLPFFWQREVASDLSTQVRLVSAPVKALFEGGHSKVSSEKFDIVLSSGLFDYLEQDVAQTLARHLFSLLRPDGKLVIANILDSEPAQAAFFRQTLMDWKIVTRSDEQMHELVPLVKAKKYQRLSDVDLGIVTFVQH